VEAAVFPREEIGDFLGAEMSAVAPGLEEAVAEEFADMGEAFFGHGVEAAFGVEEMQVRMEDEVVAEGVDGGGSGDASLGQAEPGAEGVAQAFGGGLEEEVEKDGGACGKCRAAFSGRWAEPPGGERDRLSGGQARGGRLSAGEGVNTNCRCGTSWQTEAAIHAPVCVETKLTTSEKGCSGSLAKPSLTVC